MRPSVALPWLGIVLALLGPRERVVHAEPRLSSSTSYAEQTYFEGQRLFLEKRYEAALPLFEESYRLQQSPNSRLYIARCLAELGELLSAYETYREVVVLVSEVEQPAHYAATQMAASEERAALRQQLATIRVTLADRVPGFRLQLGGRVVEQGALTDEHLADPGALTIEASAPGYRPMSYVLEAKGGQVAEVFVLMAQASETPYVPPPPTPTVREVHVDHPGDDWAWLSAGVGVAGIATWGAFGIQAQRRYERITPDCRAGDCPLDQVEAGRRETLISNVGLGVGLAGLAGAGALWLWSRQADPQPRPGYESELGDRADAADDEARIGVLVDPRGASLVGEF
jgi:hypothetical protein